MATVLAGGGGVTSLATVFGANCASVGAGGVAGEVAVGFSCFAGASVAVVDAAIAGVVVADATTQL